MGTGDYVCVTLRGGAPWGFFLRQSVQEPQHPLQVFEIEDGSHADLAGLCENDELVSVNGKPCANLCVSEVMELLEASTDCLQLLVKRCCSQPQKSLESVSTTLQIPSPSRPHKPQELYISESQDEAYFGETDSDAECPGRTRLVQMQVQVPTSRIKSSQNTSGQGDGDTRLEITPGSVVELQLSLSKTTLEEPECTFLGSACGVIGDNHQRKMSEDFNYTTTAFSPGCPLYIPRKDRKPLGQRGVLVSKPPALQRQVEVTVLQLSGSSSEKEGTEASDQLDSAGGGHFEEAPTSSSVSFGLSSEEWDSETDREVNKPNKHRARHARLRRSESLSEKQVKEAKSKCKRIALLLSAPTPNPNNKGVLMFKKHRQRAKKYTLVSYGTGEDEPDYKDEDDNEKDNEEEHAVEFTVIATSETEIDEDFFTNNSGQKSIVTFDWDSGLLEIERKLDNQTDMEALPDTKGKGALMFAQRRQHMDEIVAEHEELRRKGIPVEGAQKTETHQTYHHMEDRGYMQAQETQNYMDVNVHHSAAAAAAQKQQQYHQLQEQYYQQQQQQQQQQYQDYQQQIQYQQHQQQQYQQQQDYQQQKMYQQMQSYNQQQHLQQQQMQQYSQHMNGMLDQQINEMQPSVTNRSAKPFSVQNRAAAPFSSSTVAEIQEQPGYSLEQGEQIASRDERISVPAIKTGILQDTRRRNANKPMFTFKDSPKVSPNPALLNLLNKNDKKVGLESGLEEDYLSLGAEACNFLQYPNIKHKIPPPIAPKPHINPDSPPWSVQPETTGQLIPQQTENCGPAPAEVPATKTDSATAPVPEMFAPTMSEQEPLPTFAPESQGVSLCVEQSDPDNAWKRPASPVETNQQPETWNEKQPQPELNSAHPAAPPPANVQTDPSTRTWEQATTQGHQQPPINAWDQTEMEPEVPSQNQSQIQPAWMSHAQRPSEVKFQAPNETQPHPSWVTQTQTSLPNKHQPQPQTQPQSHMNSWTPSPNQSTLQPPWSQQHESAQPPIRVWQNQAQKQPTWAQKQQLQESQIIPPWASPHQQQPQTPWAQPESQHPQLQPLMVSQPKQHTSTQPPANAWTQPQSSVQVQPPWTQPPPQPSAPMERPMNSWTPMPVQSQPQPPWAQQPASPRHHQQINSFSPEQNQIQTSWVQPQPQNQPQVQPPWVQHPQQQTSQPPVSQWASLQTQSLPGVNAWVPQHLQSSVRITGQSETQKFSPQPIKPLSPPHPTQPTPPRRMNSYTAKASSPTPPNSTVSGFGSAFEMPALRGKGAELFAKRQSRMEKYIVDSTTVQTNKVLRSSSLSPPVRLLSVGFTTRSVSSSPSPRPASHAASVRPPVGQTSRLDRCHKPLTPWEAASRHPLGLVDAAFAFLDLPQSIASNLRYAEQSKPLPKPPAEWKAKVAYEPPPKNLKESLSQSPLSFLSPTKSTASAPTGPILYRSPFRQCQPQRSLTVANLGPSQGDQKYMGPHRLGLYKAKDSSTWRR